VKPTEERPHGLSRYWHYVLLIVGALLLNIPISPLNFTLVPRSAVVSILSSLCAVSGLAIALIARRTLADNWSSVVTFVGLWIKLKQEEALMERHFPAEYPEYQRRVKALLPFIL
jgi:protein-S-isoprenylcysteine O-methyltransferase Ste14